MFYRNSSINDSQNAEHINGCVSSNKVIFFLTKITSNLMVLTVVTLDEVSYKTGENVVVII